MAGRNAARNPKRTAHGLLLRCSSASLIIGVATLAASAKAQIRDTIGESSSATTSCRQADRAAPASVASRRAGRRSRTRRRRRDVDRRQLRHRRRARSTARCRARPSPRRRRTPLVTLRLRLTGGFSRPRPVDGVLPKDKAEALGLSVGDASPSHCSAAGEQNLTVGHLHHRRLHRTVLVDSRPVRRHVRTCCRLPDLRQGRRRRHAATSRGDARPARRAVPDGRGAEPRRVHRRAERQIDGFLNFIYALLGMSRSSSPSSAWSSR